MRFSELDTKRFSSDYYDMEIKELAEKYSTPISTTKHWCKKLGLRKNFDINDKKNKDVIEYIAENYGYDSIREMGAALGLSISLINRIIKKTGLELSEEDKKRVRQMMSIKARERFEDRAYREKAEKNLLRREKGTTLEQIFGKEKAEEIRNKQSRTMNEKIRRDRLRMKYGLPQLTNLSLTQ